MRPVGGSATEASDSGVGARGGDSGGVTPEGTARTGVKVASAAGHNGVRSRRSSPVPTKSRNTGDECPGGSRKVVNPHTWPVRAKIAKMSGGKGEPTQRRRYRVGAPAHPSQCPGIDAEGVSRPQALTRNMASSSTGLRRLKPLRSRSVAGCGNRDRKSALPFAPPFRCSRVQSNAVRCSSHLWTRALWSPTFPIFSRAL